MLMASDESDYLFSVTFRRFGCTPHSVAFVVLRDRQVGGGPGGRLKRVGHSSLGVPPLAHHVGTLQHYVGDVQRNVV